MKTTDLDKQLDDILKEFEKEIEGTQQDKKDSKAPAAQKHATFEEVDALVSEMMQETNKATTRFVISPKAKTQGAVEPVFKSSTSEIENFAMKLVEQ